jgi:hypothetical protein
MVKSWFGMSPKISQPYLDAVEMGTSFSFTIGGKFMVEFPLISSRIITQYENEDETLDLSGPLEACGVNPNKNSFDSPNYTTRGTRKLNIESRDENVVKAQPQQSTSSVPSGIRTYWYNPAKSFHIPTRQNFAMEANMEDFAVDVANKPGLKLLRIWMGGMLTRDVA